MGGDACLALAPVHPGREIPRIAPPAVEALSVSRAARKGAGLLQDRSQERSRGIAGSSAAVGPGPFRGRPPRGPSRSTAMPSGSWSTFWTLRPPKATTKWSSTWRGVSVSPPVSGDPASLVVRPRAATSSTTPRTACYWPCLTRLTTAHRRTAPRPADRLATAQPHPRAQPRARDERPATCVESAGSFSVRTRRGSSSGLPRPAAFASGGPRARMIRQRCGGTTVSPGDSVWRSGPRPAASAGPGAAACAGATIGWTWPSPWYSCRASCPGRWPCRAVRRLGRHVVDPPASLREGNHLRRAPAGLDAGPDPGRDTRSSPGAHRVDPPRGDCCQAPPLPDLAPPRAELGPGGRQTSRRA